MPTLYNKHEISDKLRHAVQEFNNKKRRDYAFHASDTVFIGFYTIYPHKLLPHHNILTRLAC